MTGLTSKEEPGWVGGVVPPPEMLGATGIQIMELDCREQAAYLRQLIDAYQSNATIRAELNTFRELAARSGAIVFAGMGASYCSAIAGSNLLQSHGRLSFTVDAGEWQQYGRSIDNDIALTMLLTTSGESAELVELTRTCGGQTHGLLCNNSASTCWKQSANKLPILAGPEYGCATKTFTNATAATIILASEMLGIAWERDANLVAWSYAADLEAVFHLRAGLEAFCRGAASIEIIGRGSAYGGAIMGALTIREMTGFRVAPHTGAGFRHGPVMDVDASHVAIVFALGRAAALGFKLAAECNRRGGKVVLVSNEDCTPSSLLFPVRIGGVPEPWEGITSLLVPQALTLAMVERTGCRLPPRFQYGVMEL
ncbi:MAG: SIS domain-containing protein [Terracidiphilus sp.]|jgi:glucosamine--fructose-6-phosphate aminotransferase (isomerizing)